MRTKMIIGIVSAITIFASTASAQSSLVTAGGSDGIATVVEVGRGTGFIGRAGLLNRYGGETWDWTGGFGYRAAAKWVTFDTAIDFESMYDMADMDPIDVRARWSVGVPVARNLAGVVEYSRSFHNRTREGRWLFGGRISFD